MLVTKSVNFTVQLLLDSQYQNLRRESFWPQRNYDYHWLPRPSHLTQKVRSGLWLSIHMKRLESGVLLPLLILKKKLPTVLMATISSCLLISRLIKLSWPTFKYEFHIKVTSVILTEPTLKVSGLK